MRKIQNRWSEVTFRSFRLDRLVKAGGDIREIGSISVTFRIFRSSGNYGRMMFPPFRGETYFKVPTGRREVSARSASVIHEWYQKRNKN